MWTQRSEELANGRGVKVAVELDSTPVPYSVVLQRWQHDAGFRAFFLGLLAGSPFAAFRWETPPVTAASADRPFEFVLLDSPYLAITPDRDAFAGHFAAAGGQSVVSFPNLGGDAVLVVPGPAGPAS